MLTQIRDRLSARVVLCEPFCLEWPGKPLTMRGDVDGYVDVVRELAEEFSATVLPLNTIFAEARKRAEAAYWTRDGVHPTPAGHALIAQQWLKWVFGIEC
jgi:lysophospholipase L1-like esterase